MVRGGKRDKEKGGGIEPLRNSNLCTSSGSATPGGGILLHRDINGESEAH